MIDSLSLICAIIAAQASAVNVLGNGFNAHVGVTEMVSLYGRWAH